MITIQINTNIFPHANDDFIYRIADITLKRLKVDQSDITIAIEGNKRLRELNRSYRGIDAATDVLSFSSDQINPETGIKYLGDVIISFPKTKIQASEQDHTVRDELATLIIHGILHLAGFNHKDKSSEKAMFSLQNELLDTARLNTYPEKSLSIPGSFGYAFEGFISAFRSERNMWIHLAISLAVIAVGLILKISLIEWGLLVFSIALVFTTEFINTAFEYLVNIVSPERNESARRIKDISAAAVLITALAAAMIGLLVFLPKILSAFSGLF